MPLGTKVKTQMLYAAHAVAAGDAEWTVSLDSHTFQDDIRVIGCQVGQQVSVTDAATNADHEMQAISELSRHGAPQADGAIARANWGNSYNAVLNVPTGSPTAQAPFCFPDRCGIDFDDGEAIYLHFYGLNVGTVAFNVVAWAIVYYIER